MSATPVTTATASTAPATLQTKRTVTAADRPLLNSKWFLYVTEFFSGMAVMAAELGASRLLAPYFSSSQIVWTIIIGTIMIALALGAVVGGKWADRDPNPDRLYRRILIAAVWIALIPVIGPFIVVGVSGLLVVTVSTNFLTIAAFVSCMAIFVPPLFLLGTVTPALNKFATDSLETNASVVGRLSACNTVGSILGTFLPTFVTIPAVGTFVTFLLFSGVLLALPIIYFLYAHVHRIACAVAAILFAVSGVWSAHGSFAFWDRSNTIAYEGESIYNYLQVRDESDRTILSTNVLFGVQSVAMKHGDLTGMYYDTALAAPALADDAQSALILGMGTGTYAKQLRTFYPQMQVTGVEIDGDITRLAHDYFGQPKDIAVAEYDGRAYLSAVDERYDVIMVDAYQDITIPFQMSTVEFFTLVRDHLNEGGVMVVNMNMISDGEGSINESLAATIAHVFGDDNIMTADVNGMTNRELFALKPNADTDLAQRVAALAERTIQRTHSAPLAATMDTVSTRMTSLASPSANALVMTDDRAPVEVLGMRAIDGLIAQQVEPYRDILRNEGIRGLVNSLS